jgi:type IV secretory pathway VirB2 component (pilin)
MNINFTKNDIKKIIVTSTVISAIIILNTSPVFASGQDLTFDTTFQTIVGWTKSPIGKMIAGIAIIFGIIAGLVKQSLSELLIWVVTAIGLIKVPDIINFIFK